MRSIPFLIVPFVIYNLIAVMGFAGGPAFWDRPLLQLSMISGGFFTLTGGAALILFALFFLFIEMIKSTRVSTAAIWDHVAATFVFIAFLLEFILVPAAATSTFVVLGSIALIDLLAGFAVSLRSATRDIAIDNGFDL